jgi:hypothetical protein
MTLALGKKQDIGILVELTITRISLELLRLQVKHVLLKLSVRSRRHGYSFPRLTMLMRGSLLDDLRLS